MTDDKFSEITNYVRGIKPDWFLSEDEFLVTSEDISNVQRELSWDLPKEYVFFLLNYRAGYFAFLNIYSVNKNSDWYLIDKNKELESISIPNDFIAFSDDETGGYYGFIKNGFQHSSEVYFFDSSDNQSLTPVGECFFEFVINKAFKPEYFGLNLP